MLSLVFFARVKEQLDCARLELEWNESMGSLSALREHLYQLKGSHWRDVLTEDNIILAVNHRVVDDQVVLRDGDEVAFFPPVTGG